jgi:formylglycine-generating enzyme required for sulfatase activity
VDTERDQLQSRQVVERMAESWGKGRGGLVTGGQLRTFRPLLKSCVALSDQAGQFLRESLRQARLRTAATATLGAIVLGILGAFGYWINKEEMGPAMAFYVLVGKVGWIVKQPEMVVMPAGSFEMGCVSGKGCNDDERPVHQVTFDKPFALGKYEVTFEQYELFAKLRGRPVPGTAGFGKGKQPVVNVFWEDARDYAKWLAEETGKGYRLPTEAEWEYAARAGTRTPFSTGGCINTDQANYDGNGGWEDCPATGVYREKAVEVGSLPANPWGLHEVHGNVWEWVEDCWHEDYEGAPADASAWLDDGGQCGRRVLRGGAWRSYPEFLRSASRGSFDADSRTYAVGFRLAQDLLPSDP